MRYGEFSEFEYSQISVLSEFEKKTVVARGERDALGMGGDVA
jgi:hypothetical protein